MFALRFGVSGAAVATVLAQYIILGLLLWKLSRKVTLLPSHFSDLRFNHFLKSGKYMLPLILCRSWNASEFVLES
jgi:Na+-driven multidrug efflux pump